MKRLSKIPALLITLTMFHVASADSPLVEADAVEKKDQAAVRKLLEKNIDVNASQTDGMTALHWAAYQDDLATAKLLLNASANVKAKNRYGVTSLSLACINGNVRTWSNCSSRLEPTPTQVFTKASLLS